MRTALQAAPSRPASRRGFLSVLVLAALLGSCAGKADPYYIVGTGAQKGELATLFGLLADGPRNAEDRFAVNQRIATILLEEKEYGRAETFLTLAADSDASPQYKGYYLFMAGYAYGQQGSAPIAAYYYHRVVKNYPDLLVKGQSIHLACLQQLISLESDSEQKVDYYRELLARFPDNIDMGSTLFKLGQTYEKLGEWDLVVQTYQRMLPYPDIDIPGFPEAFQYAKKTVDFWSSSKDWTYESLDELVAKVQAAIRNQDPSALERLRAKVNFFAMTWVQNELDENSQVEFDLRSVMAGNSISVSQTLDPSSNARNAYLRTTGWARIPVWYFYFRKINFPADPEIHGRWEWAGIYFGEKLK